MAMSILRLLLAAAVAALAGCGSGATSNTASSRVTPAMRAACLDWADNDSEIAALLFEIEGSHEQGYTRAQAQIAADDSCLNACETYPYPGCGIACLTCNYALLDATFTASDEEPIPGDGDPSSIETFDDVVSSCRSGSLVFTTDEVATLIDFANIDKEDGISYGDSITTIVETCETAWGSGTADASACLVCYRAAVNLAYGR
jgi:hypothetical protein